MAGLLGVFRPKIAGATTVTFSYSKLLEFNVAGQTIENKDEVSGHMKAFTKGDDPYVTIRFIEHIYKYTVPATSFQAIEALLKSEVRFYFDNTLSAYFKKADGFETPFYFASIQWFHLESATYQDAVILTFISTAPVDFGNIVAGTYWLDSDGNLVEDHDGNYVEVHQ